MTTCSTGGSPAASSSTTDGLPAGLRIRLDPSGRRLDRGKVLIGGSPLKVMRLSDTSQSLLDHWLDGGCVDSAPHSQQLARKLLDSGVVHPVPAGTSFTVAQVTVVIPVRDMSEGLKALIPSLPGVARIIVVDDGSAAPVDKELLMTLSGGTPVLLVRKDVSGGPAVAREDGFTLVDTPLAVFVDADCLPEAGCIHTLIAHFDDGKVGAVAPRIRASLRETEGPQCDGGFSFARRAALFETYCSPLDLGAHESPVRPRAKVPYVPTALLAVRCDAFRDVGGFDRELRVGEDVDIVWRLSESGWTVRYEPKATARHIVRGDVRSWLSQRFGYGTSAAPLSKRHGSSVAPLSISKWSAGMWGLAGAGQPMAATSLGIASTALLAVRLRKLPNPYEEAWRLAGLGNIAAGSAILGSLRRTWWPATLLASLFSRRARRVAVLALLFPPLSEYLRIRPEMGPLSWFAFKTADDVSYGAGVWAGCLDEGTVVPLLPAGSAVR